MDTSAILAAARQHIAWDVNDETRAQLQSRVDSSEAGDAVASAWLTSAFRGRIEFGTAGLRGEMSPGSARMNDITVIQAAQGLATYVLALHGVESAAKQGVVVAFDHRARGSLSSRRFAALSAAALSSRGIRVHLFPRFGATPLVPFAVRHLGACAGVVVTASHNPKADNGYKVYGASGSQIVSPVDAEISAAIGAHLAPWDDVRPLYCLPTDALEAMLAAASPEALATVPLPMRGCIIRDSMDAIVTAYVAAVSGALCRRRTANAGARPIAYTAMHGVGAPFAAAIFAAFGLPAYIPTPEQVFPDPDFPTVPFPNPEEGAGALSLAMGAAERAGVTLVVANDPDADRLAVAERLSTGEWRVFTGDEVGALLAAWLWHGYVSRGGTPSRATMIASTVSSKMLRAMSAAEGFRFVETLTGFKWMGAEMGAAEARGETVLLAYEEAIGYACCGAVRDKDGISAAAVVAEMAAALASGEGTPWAAANGGVPPTTLCALLTALHVQYGVHVTLNRYLRVESPATSDAIFARLRNSGHYWSRISNELSIVRTRDLSRSPMAPGGWDSGTHRGVPELPVSSGSHMLTFTLSNGAIVTLRTSGTEPKLKIYAELAGQGERAHANATAFTDSRAVISNELRRTVTLIIDEMLQPDVHGLQRPNVD